MSLLNESTLMQRLDGCSVEYKVEMLKLARLTTELKLRIHGFIGMYIGKGYKSINGLIAVRFNSHLVRITELISKLLNDLKIKYTKRMHSSVTIFLFEGGEKLKIQHLYVKPILTKKGKPYKKPKFTLANYDCIFLRFYCFIHCYDIDENLVLNYAHIITPSDFELDFI